ncbi:chromate efflux transporter [Sneathiella chungangensis]|uniref:Chromate efflux transporter n=1 Tax=Sneathiella chungangensis TaxID=1418234 RepID=A0A845MH14_9PROT|nr:chromate efflux transporter [Sneathiella chungangensis]MZR22304.1 chromate efflux transporter [Sneathiella chungangensis]
MNIDATPAKEAPEIGELFAAFGRIGLLSFGGPAAQIALMHRVLVDEKRWLSERRYLNALSFCMLLPGPEAMQLATYAGWRLKGLWGGLMAGLLFVLPGAAVILALAGLYAYFGSVPLMAALFLGIKAAVVIIVIEALLKVARRALKKMIYWIIAALAFIGIFFLALPFPLIVFAAALFGFFWRDETHESETLPAVRKTAPLQTALTIALGLVIWWAPVLLIDQLSETPILTEIALFFSKLAVVTFGGAYAVLAYMAQDVVVSFGWLNAGQMMDGLGLAETTPGPLILVTEFVGFLAAFREGGFLLGLAGAALTLWVTFVPCFLWIFAGAPYIDRISNQPRLAGALNAITAAVVGVILNLSLWFALHVFFTEVTMREAGPLTLWQPMLASFDARVLALALISGFLLLYRHWPITPVLLVAAAGGVALDYLV